MTVVKEALENEEATADELKEKTDALMQAAMKLGEAMYKASQEEGAEGMPEGMEGFDPNNMAAGMGGDAGGDADTPADETVVDAEFEEVDPDKPEKPENKDD